MPKAELKPRLPGLATIQPQTHYALLYERHCLQHRSHNTSDSCQDAAGVEDEVAGAARLGGRSRSTCRGGGVGARGGGGGGRVLSLALDGGTACRGGGGRDCRLGRRRFGRGGGWELAGVAAEDLLLAFGSGHSLIVGAVVVACYDILPLRAHAVPVAGYAGIELIVLRLKTPADDVVGSAIRRRVRCSGGLGGHGRREYGKGQERELHVCC